MNQGTYSVRALDLHYLFLGIQYLALIVLIVIVARSLIGKPNFIEDKFKTLSWVCTSLLIIGLTGMFMTDLYTYVHTTRPGYIEINQTIKHQATGL